MKLDDKEHVEIIGDSFNKWYKTEIESYVARCDLPHNFTEKFLAERVVSKVSKFILGRLVGELRSVGISTSDVIAFLKKHATE